MEILDFVSGSEVQQSYVFKNFIDFFGRKGVSDLLGRLKKSDFSSDKQLAKWDKIAKKEGIGYIDFELIRVYRRYVDLGAFSVVDHRKAQNYILAMSMTDLAFILKRNINQFKMQGLVRLAEVEWIEPMSRGFWMAQFITMDYYPGEKTPIINIWRAYVRAILAPIPYENQSLREQNPFGFLVINYSTSYVGTPEDPESYLRTAKDVRFGQYVY